VSDHPAAREQKHSLASSLLYQEGSSLVRIVFRNLDSCAFAKEGDWRLLNYHCAHGTA